MLTANDKERKIIQISCCGVNNNSQTQCNNFLFALCDDNSLWMIRDIDNNWLRIPNIPDRNEFERCVAVMDERKEGEWVNERDIAKKPEEVLTDSVFNHVTYYCPACDCRLAKYDNFCQNCGQRIDWSKI